MLSRSQQHCETKNSNGFRILQIVQEFTPSGGGVETAAFELANAWNRAGIPTKTVTRVTGNEVEGGEDIELIAQWLRKIPVRGLSAFRYLGRLIVVPAFTFAATFAASRNRDALILSQNGDTLSGDVLVVHSVHAAMIGAKRRAGVWSWLLNPLNIWLAARDRFMIGSLRYRKYVAVSPRVSTELQTYHKVPEQQITVIPNGVDLDKFKPDPAARQRIRSEFGIAGQSKLLLFVGNDLGRKGLAHAIEAVGRLEQDFVLLVVGAGDHASYRRILRTRPDRLIFAGERGDIPAFYAAADALVLPSSYETFSLVCLEAMASGVPVFATRVGGIEDYLEDGVNGYIITTCASDIAAKISLALQDEKRLDVLRNNARATGRRYSWDDAAARYVSLLREVWDAKAESRDPSRRHDSALQTLYACEGSVSVNKGARQ